MSKILLAGNDFRLLATRAAVLAKTKANVICCNAPEAMTVLEAESFDLVVLCHSLGEKQAIEITGKVRLKLPKVRILMVISDVANDVLYKGVQFDATTSPEPGSLIRHATELLEKLPNHRLGEPISV
jgi:DNA-binding response OmpR family regulator